MALSWFARTSLLDIIFLAPTPESSRMRWAISPFCEDGFGCDKLCATHRCFLRFAEFARVVFILFCMADTARMVPDTARMVQ